MKRLGFSVKFFALGLVAARVFIASVHAQTFIPTADPDADRELIPAALGLRTDKQGNSWNFQQNGTLGRIGNSMLNTGMELYVNNQRFYSQQPLMTKNGREFVLPGRTGATFGGLTVSRRVKLDEKTGVVRYVEVFQNPTAAEVAAQVEIRSNLGGNYKNYVTNSGNPGATVLKRDQTGILVTSTASNVNRALVLTLRSAGSKLKPTITSQSRYMVSSHFQIRVPAGETRCLLHTVAQVPIPGGFDRKALAEVFRPGALHRHLTSVPATLRPKLANFSLGEEARGLALLSATSIDRLGVKRGRKDVLAVGEETRLIGAASCANLEIATEFGKAQIAFEDVSAVVGGNRGKRDREKIFQRDGQVLGGNVAAQDFRFVLHSGNVMDLEVSKLDRLVRGENFETRREKLAIPDGAVAFLETHGGDRLALLPLEETRLNLVSPWGSVEVGLGEISAVSTRESEPVGHLVELKNGSRFYAFAGGAEFAFETPRFGRRSIPPSQIRAIVSREAADPAQTRVSAWETPRLTQPYLDLRGRQRIVGPILAPQLTILTEGESVQTPPETIRHLINQLGDESDRIEPEIAPPFRAELWGGGVISGNLRERLLNVRLHSAEWQIPVSDVVQAVVPTPRISDATRAAIAKWIRDLGNDDWQTRERASEELAEFGYLAKPQLVEAGNFTNDAEVNRRVEMLLRRLE